MIPPPSPQTPLPTPLWGLGERVWERGQGPLAPGPLSQGIFSDYLHATRCKEALPLPQPGPPLLLINPWIYDFAAYDFFARPLGLLYLAGLLRAQGYEVQFLDCLGAPHARSRTFRHRALPQGNPAAAPGAGGHQPALRALWHQRGGFPGAPGPGPRPRRHPGDLPHDLLVPRGGRGHPPGPGALPRRARHPGRDLRHPVPGACPATQRRRPGGRRAGRSGHFSPLLEEITGWLAAGSDLSGPREHLDSLPYPALDLLDHPSYIPILTSRGCPLDCDYCASRLLQPGYRRRDPRAVAGRAGLLAGPTWASSMRPSMTTPC